MPDTHHPPKINFFEARCQESTDAQVFGLTDGLSHHPAHIYLHTPSAWTATIENAQRLNVTFTAIDNCIPIFRPNGEMENRCEGMLHYSILHHAATERHIVFVELKEAKKSNWLQHGIHQLETTVQLFANVHPLSEFSTKRAFLCNSKRPHFNVSHKDAMKAFYLRNQVRLIIEARIVIG